jgi:hypothetical protein
MRWAIGTPAEDAGARPSVPRFRSTISWAMRHARRISGRPHEQSFRPAHASISRLLMSVMSKDVQKPPPGRVTPALAAF